LSSASKKPIQAAVSRNKLGEELQAMSVEKTIPEGLKWIECKHDVIGKISHIRYIPEQDPMQDALQRSKKTTYFKLTLPNMGNDLKWQFGHLGLSSSSYCMCISRSRCASSWGLT
jgi:hypothetical protein